MSPRMKAGQFTDAIVEAIRGIGIVLQQHFPAARDDTNELPNAVAGD